MPEEVTEILAEVSAPDRVATAAPESVEASQPVESNEQLSKTFTQEELDQAIGKRLAREQRKWEREQQQRLADIQAVKKPVEAQPEQFNSPEEYAEALAYQKAEELISKREQAKRQSEVLESYHDKEEEARNKYDDFEQVAYNPNLPITNVMAETIQSSDIGPDLAYYLGANPKEADRISRLSPFLQAKEIGKIEAKLSDNPPVKKTSSAPAPIAPVTARGNSGNAAFDTTDPRSTKTMSASEWIEAERRRQIKKAEARLR